MSHKAAVPATATEVLRDGAPGYHSFRPAILSALYGSIEGLSVHQLEDKVGRVHDSTAPTTGSVEFDAATLIYEGLAEMAHDGRTLHLSPWAKSLFGGGGGRTE